MSKRALPATPERRRLTRNRVYKGAKITFGNFLYVIDCQLYDLTREGARLRLQDGAPVPSTFHLFFTDERRIGPVRVIWRRGRDLGVAFDGEPVPVHGASDPRLKRFAFM